MNILISVSTRTLYNPTQWRRRKRKEVGNILVFNKYTSILCWLSDLDSYLNSFNFIPI